MTPPEQRPMTMFPRDAEGAFVPGPNVRWPVGLDQAMDQAEVLFHEYETAYICPVMVNANDKGVTVNAVAPGYIATEMVAAMPEEALKKIAAQIPVGRLGEADEIGECVAFLAGDKAGFITGAVLTANGGQYIAA